MRMGQTVRGSITDTVLDILETDGGWLTSHGIAIDTGFTAKSVEHALFTQRKRGVVESRRVDLALRANGSPEFRTEWRLAKEQE